MKNEKKKKLIRMVSAWVALSLFSQYAFPVAAYALTSGPGQPEFSSFEPVGTSDMVDLYSGDFSYNIPLLSVPGPNGGYPINLAYHSGPGVDEEASWVGLGWNVNVGAINRQLRGLPDDFKGDQVTQRFSLKKNRTTMLNTTSQIKEFFGVEQNQPTNPVWQIYYNNYKGLGYRVSQNLHAQQINAGLDLSFDSQNGIGVEPDFSVSTQLKKYTVKANIGIGYNSRQGLQEGSFSTSSSSNIGYKNKGTEQLGSSLGFSTQFNIPSVNMPMRTNTYPYSLHVNPNSATITWGWMKANFPQSLRGYVSESDVANNGVMTSNAYGYMYNSSSASQTDMRDFQRENMEYSKKVPNLAPSSFTYDQFSQSGQGTGSQFRSYANNVGVMTDRKTVSNDYTYPIGVEFGSSLAPNFTFQHYGAGFSYQAGTSESGAWGITGNNLDIDFASALNYSTTTKPGYQASPFKVFGEKTGVLNSEDHLKNWGGDQAVKVKLDKSSDPNWMNRQYVAKNLFVTSETDNNGFAAGSTQKMRNANRERRATNIEYISDADFANFGITRNTGYTNTAGVLSNKVKTAQGGTKSNHISEIVTVQPDGMRYVYGLPAYNNVQYDGSFAVNNNTGNFNTKTVSIPHTAGSWQPDVSNTYDQFSQQTEVGPYVHSWLLTTVVSADYVDLQNDGPTEDDYGYWVRFNYDKTSSNYYWHVPYQGANYLEGKKGDPTDDRGTYSSGNREEYYLQSVETKTHIAVFYTSKRQDGVNAQANLNGGLPVGTPTDPQSLFKLDSVKLYTKEAYYSNITTRTINPLAVAIKTVHFRYSYELCGKPSGANTYYGQFITNNTGLPIDENGQTVASNSPANINANRGKLTLKKVWFTYQTSERGEFSPYLFNYESGANGSDDNPYYDPTAVDRWGNFKKNANYQGAGNNYPYIDQSYTDQESTQAAQEQKPIAGAWSLKKLTLPSGAVMDVTYEADDYGYVEDQKAMRMFDIYHVGRNLPSVFNDQRQASSVVSIDADGGNSSVDLQDGQYRVYFRLDKTVATSAYNTTTLRSDYVKTNFLNNGNLKKMYFRTFMDLLNSGNTQNKDYVSGYADIVYGNEITSGNSPFGLASSPGCPGGQYDLGYVLLAGENINAPLNIPPLPKINPFIKAALQYLHFDRSELVHTPVPYSNSIPAQIGNLLNSYATGINDISQAMVGFNAWAYMKGYCHKMDLNGRSTMRLCEPDGIKYGGGSRVKQITINDNWDNDPTNTVSGVDPDNSTYGMTYDYTITEGDKIISSGVCYEPRIGGEESALRNPITYVNSTPMHSSENLFLETPLLESYYPGAMVGYRKVTAKSIAPDIADKDDDNTANNSNRLLHNAAPITIYEFFTPKEFPVIFDQTDINADPAIVRPVIIPGIYTSFTKRKARSQGYSVVLNDMSGKPRAVTQRTRPNSTNPNGTLISRMEYVYNTEQPFSDNVKNKLSSKVQVLLADGTFQTASVGQTHDIFIDMNENHQSSVGGGLDANLDVQNLPTPILVPTFYATVNKRDLSMRTVVVNKIIYRTGIVKEVIATHEASTIKTESIAFDIETGEPLLTKTTNEFRDPIYNYTYPGHWYYAGLKGGYINQGVVVDNIVTDVNGNTQTLAAMSVSANGRINGIQAYIDGMSPLDYFTPGDEVWVDFVSATDQRYHVMKVGATFIDLIARNGQYITTGTNTINSIRIIRSGHDNMQSVSVGSVATRTLIGIPQYDPQNPGTNYTVNTNYSLTNFLSAHALELYDIMRVDCTPACATDNVQVGQVVDPYAIGTRGVWRPFASYAFSTDRLQADNIRTDGTYIGFSAFRWDDPTQNNPAWITASTITRYSPHGFEIENKDANNIYSSALYEYNKTLNSAVASNAQYKEIAYESFEDLNNPNLCTINSDHWGFSSATYASMISTTYAHTGKRSIILANNTTVSLVSNVTVNNCETSNAAARINTNPNSSTATPLDVLDDCDCNGIFSPVPGKKYLLMAWVKQTPVGGSTVNTQASYASPKITVDVWDGSTTTSTGAITATGPVIDGWQRVYMTFDVPANGVSVTVKLTNDAGTLSDDYFDDIRIQPFDANMMTYVYDPLTYRLVAQLDANNFATYYIYDEQGGLEKMKVETAAGIKTVKEGRMNMDKH
jgi:hypothetical protein